MSSNDNYEYAALLESFRGAQKQFFAGNQDFAEPIFRGALSKLSESSSELAECLRDLAEISARRGDYNESIRLYLRLLSVRSAVEDNSSVAKAMEKVAALYEATGRLNEAEYMFSRAKVLRGRLAGGNAEPALEAVSEVGAPEESIDGCLGPPPGWLKNAFAEADKAYGRKKPLENQDDLGKNSWDRKPAASQEKDYGWSAGSAGETSGTHSSYGNRAQSPDAEPSLPKVFSQPKRPAPPPAPTYNFTAPSAPSRPTSEGPRRPPPPRSLEHRDPAPGREPPAFTPSPKAGDASGRRSGGQTRDQLSGTGNLPPPGRGSMSPKSNEIISGIVLPSTLIRSWTSNLESFSALYSAAMKGVHGKPQMMSGIMAVVIVYSVCFLAAFVIAPKKRPEMTTQIGDKFQSADMEKLFELIDRNTAEVHAGAKYSRVNCRQYKGDFGDALALSTGAFSEKQYCLERRGNSLKDPDGTVLYLANSPEIYVINQVESIDNVASLDFAKDQIYPVQFSKDDLEKLTYRNPFDNTNETPRLNHLEIDKPGSSQEADYARLSIYNQLAHGGGWENRPNPTPGALDCCSIVLKSPRGNINAFVCQPLDRHGHPFSGSLPHTSYFFALEDGKHHHPARPNLAVEGGPSLRQPVVWLIEPNLDDSAVDLLKHGCFYFFACAAVMLFVAMNLLYLDKITKAFMWCAVGGSGLAALLYFLVPILP